MSIKKKVPPSIADNPAISFWQYLAAALIPILFIVFSLSFLIRYLKEQQQQIRSEIEGVAVINSLHEGVILLQRLRGLSEIAHNGGPVRPEELTALQTRFIDFSDSFRAQNQVTGLGLPSEIAELQERAELLFRGGLPEKSHQFSAHTELIMEMLRLINIVGAKSLLMLDAEASSFHLTDIMVNHLPDLMEAIGRLRGIGSGMLVSGTWSVREEIILREYLAALQAHLEGLEKDIESISRIDPHFGELLSPVLANEALSRFVSQSEQLLQARSPAIGALEYFEIGTAAIAGYSGPQRQMAAMLTESLSGRLNDLERLKIQTLYGTLFAILLLLYFSTAFYQRNRAAFRRIEEMAITDMLTGLYNRRYLGMVIGQEMQRARRERKSFALAVLDIDFFKNYNDQYGHQVGDEVLRRVAAAMKSCLQRPGDFLFRIGGEEFCFFFSGESAVEAMGMAERVRTSVESMGISHAGSRVSSFVTVSVGVAFLPEVTAIDFDPVMKLADDALYQAKAAGRNCCRFSQAAVDF